MDGLLIIDKPAGITSHDVVSRVRRILKTKRVGHTGTLDPFATGVMVVLVGKATRLAQFLDKDEKEYEAVVKFGFETDTGDVTGTPKDPVQRPSLAEVEQVLPRFRGDIQQTPPMYSAKKVEGKKLYEHARKGETIERKAVPVTISSLQISADGAANDLAAATLRVTCSAGTYIRTLAEDIARAAGSAAHLIELRRTRAGRFSIDEAISIDDVAADKLQPIELAVEHLPSIVLNADRTEKTKQGMSTRILDSSFEEGKRVRMLSETGELIAIGTFDAAESSVKPRSSWCRILWMRKRNIALAALGAAGAVVAVKMLARAATVDWEDVRNIIPHADRSRFMNLDGIRIHFQEFGRETDPPLILIHGYTASVYVWKTAAPLIAAKGFRVIAVDLVGFGYTEKPRWFDYTIQSQARMLLRFMNRLGVGRAFVVGSSYGGAVAATLGLDYPERVHKLVLVDAVINDDLKSHPILKLASFRGLGEVITPFLADSKMLMRRRMRGTIHASNHHLVDRDRVESIRRPLFAADGHHSLLATSRAWDANRITEDASLITHPTLIIWGEEDTVIPIRDAYTLQSQILHSQLVVFKDCGHVPQEERSELFAEKVAEFCGK